MPGTGDVPGNPTRTIGIGIGIGTVGIGTYRWDLATGGVLWDERMLAIFEDADSTFDGTIDGCYRRVHPRDLPTVTRAVRAALASRGEFEVEFRAALASGRSRWVEARGRVVCDRDGSPVGIEGAAYDTTGRQQGAARVARVLEAMPTAFFSLDGSWRFTYVNAEAERVLASPREDLLGGDLWTLFPAAAESAFGTAYRHAVSSGESVAFEAFYPDPLNRWYEVRAWPSPDGLAVYFLDITARRGAQERAELAAARAALIAAVTAQLAETLEVEEAVARLAQLVVPELADWCVVTIVDDDADAGSRRSTLRDIGSWHAEAEARELVQRYATLRLEATKDRVGLNQALRTAEAIVVREHAGSTVAQALAPGEARDAIERLAPGSLTVLPMRARGRTVGALSLFYGPARSPVTSEELVTAQEVAGRAGLALDNSRLYRQQRQLAEVLQRSLLTQPPEPDHVQIVVRYQPAAQAAQVGGDWYDAFLQADGATVLVIGDVAGHDVTAASEMGQVRSILRGIGVTTGNGPAELLHQVDTALQLLQSETIATAVVARIEQTDDERARGITHVRWSNAGHPDPMVMNPDGSVMTMSGVQPDPLLGVMPQARRFESEVTLDRGATVLLYTDGLVERRDQGLHDGMVVLRDTLAALAALDLGLDELCDELLRRMLPPDPSDDVALLAVRLHRQDRPRPPEAGPNRVPSTVPDTPEIEDQPG